MTEEEEFIQCIHPDPSKSMPRITRRKYDAVRQAILQAVQESADGILFQNLAGAVTRLLSPADLEVIGSVGWYTVTVKLDLEARGLIYRLPKTSPQRIKINNPAS